MDFSKIQLTKQRTLSAVYKDGDGNVITFVGANIVHRDLREAMQALVPHLAVITEQREAYNETMKALKKQRITDEGENNIYKRLDVEGVTFENNEREVSISGQRILSTVGVMKMQTPRIDTEDKDTYKYCDDLSLDLEQLKYEAKEYIEQRKWGVKEGDIAFEDIDPFKGVEASEVPIADGQQPVEGVGSGDGGKKKRGRKAKAA